MDSRTSTSIIPPSAPAYSWTHENGQLKLVLSDQVVFALPLGDVFPFGELTVYWLETELARTPHQNLDVVFSALSLLVDGDGKLQMWVDNQSTTELPDDPAPEDTVLAPEHLLDIEGIDKGLLVNLNEAATSINSHFGSLLPLSLHDQLTLARQCLIVAGDLLNGLPDLENGYEYKVAETLVLAAEHKLDFLERTSLVRVPAVQPALAN